MRRATSIALPARRLLRHFYPRSPCGERLVSSVDSADKVLFLSTLSLRRATVINLAAIQSYIFLSTLSLRRATFHPLSVGLVGVFLSTLSLRRATETGRKWLRNAWNFYPRSPCGERRLGMVAKAAQDTDFYPRSPCGERLCPQAGYSPRLRISIHALLAESDRKGLRCVGVLI